MRGAAAGGPAYFIAGFGLGFFGGLFGHAVSRG
jgi:hypothetical protein